MLHGEGAIEPHLEYADLFALGHEVVHRLVERLGARAHDHDHTLGVGGAHIVEEVVPAPGQRGEFVHGRLHNGRRLDVVGIHRLARLEVDVRVLRRPAHDRLVRREATGTVGLDQVIVDQGADDFVLHHFQLVDLVGGAEAVENVEERHTGFQGGGLGDEREVHDLLDRVAEEHGPTGGPGRHDVAVVAKDGQTLRGQRPGGDVEDRAGQFARDLVHVGNHEQQALAGREGRGQRAGLKRTVDRTGRTAFGLHLHHMGAGTPNVGLALGRPQIGVFAHG